MHTPADPSTAKEIPALYASRSLPARRLRAPKGMSSTGRMTHRRGARPDSGGRRDVVSSRRRGTAIARANGSTPNVPFKRQHGELRNLSP
jgi:hypothetical protein